MALTPEQASFMEIAKRLARSNAGLPPERDLASRDFTYEQQIAYNKALAAIIAKYPNRFPANSVDTAKKVMEKQYEPLESYSLGEAAKDFAKEVGNQAIDINDRLNPFSVPNRAATGSSLKWLVIALAVGSFAVYFGPALFSGGQRLRTAASRRSAF